MIYTRDCRQGFGSDYKLFNPGDSGSHEELSPIMVDGGGGENSLVRGVPPAITLDREG